MATVLGLEECDIRVRNNPGTSLRSKADERIIRCVQNERGYGDVFNDAGSCRPVVVIVGACEAAIMRGYFIVEFAQAPDALATAYVEVVRKQFRFCAQPSPKFPQKVLFIETIPGGMQGIG